MNPITYTQKPRAWRGCGAFWNTRAGLPNPVGVPDVQRGEQEHAAAHVEHPPCLAAAQAEQRHRQQRQKPASVPKMMANTRLIHPY